VTQLAMRFSAGVLASARGNGSGFAAAFAASGARGNGGFFNRMSRWFRR
jgi:hypothetical protein